MHTCINEKPIVRHKSIAYIHILFKRLLVNMGDLPQPENNVLSETLFLPATESTGSGSNSNSVANATSTQDSYAPVPVPEADGASSLPRMSPGASATTSRDGALLAN